MFLNEITPEYYKDALKLIQSVNGRIQRVDNKENCK